MIEQDLKSHGNDDVELVIIPEADHSLQEIAESEDQRLKERMSLESFRRPYWEEYLLPSHPISIGDFKKVCRWADINRP